MRFNIRKLSRIDTFCVKELKCVSNGDDNEEYNVLRIS